MSGRTSTQDTNNEDQPNDLERIVTRQLKAALPDLVIRLTEALNASHGNPGGIPANNNQGCTYKTFMTCKPKEFHGKEGAVGLISWIESMETVLRISK